MNIVFFMTLIFLSYVGSKLFGKRCSDLVVGGSVASYSLYFVVNGVVACAFFFVVGGFTLSINLPTAIYSIIFSIIVMISVVGLVAYKYADVATITIVTSTCGLVATSVLGALIFKESFELITLIRILIMLVAVILAFLDKNRGAAELVGEERQKKKTSWLIVPIIIVVLLSNSATTIITKFYALDATVVDENSFFFFTNVFLVAFSSIAFAVDSLRNKNHFKSAVVLVKSKSIVWLVGNVICSNVGSLVGLLLIALIDVSVYSPVTSALGILSGVVASLIFRERLGALSYIAAVLSCVAVFI